MQNLYCMRLGCREIVSQYKNCIVTRQGTWVGLYCNTATTPTTRRWAGRAGGRVGRASGGAQVGARGRQAAGPAGAERHGASGRARGAQAAGGRWASRHAAGAGHGRAGQGRSSAGRRQQARGLARAVHLVHSACFWPGSTRYFS